MKDILVLFTCLSFLSGFGQDSIYEKQLEKNSNKGYSFYGIDKDSAQFYFDTIEKLARIQKDTLTLIDILITSNRHQGYFNDLRKISSNLKKIDFISDDKLPFWQELEDPLLYQNSINYDKGNYYYKIGAFVKAKIQFRNILDSYKGLDPKNLTQDHFDLFGR